MSNTRKNDELLRFHFMQPTRNSHFCLSKQMKKVGNWKILHNTELCDCT
jgi:hypothetical protein